MKYIKPALPQRISRVSQLRTRINLLTMTTTDYLFVLVDVPYRDIVRWKKLTDS